MQAVGVCAACEYFGDQGPQSDERPDRRFISLDVFRIRFDGDLRICNFIAARSPDLILRLSADVNHGAGGLEETGLADVVACFLALHGAMNVFA